MSGYMEDFGELVFRSRQPLAATFGLAPGMYFHKETRRPVTSCFTRNPRTGLITVSTNHIVYDGELITNYVASVDFGGLWAERICRFMEDVGPAIMNLGIEDGPTLLFSGEFRVGGVVSSVATGEWFRPLEPVSVGEVTALGRSFQTKNFIDCAGDVRDYLRNNTFVIDLR